jgi:hypothetical protein
LPDAVQPEVFLHLTESLAQTVTRIRVPRNSGPEAAAADAYHAWRRAMT